MRVSVVIAAHNEGPDLEATVALAYASTLPPFEVIVVDDASDPAIDPRRLPEQVKLFRLEEQQGPGFAKGYGASKASGDLITILDSHMRMPYDWLAIAYDASKKYPDALLCTTCKGFDRGGFMAAGAEFKDEKYDVSWCIRGKIDEIDVVPCLLGACYFIPRKIYTYLSGMNPYFFGWGYEEQDMSMRAWIGGFEVRRINSLVVAHRFDRSPLQSALPSWYLEYNALITLYSNLSAPDLGKLLADCSPQAQRFFEDRRVWIEGWRKDVQRKRILPDSAIPMKADSPRWKATRRRVEVKSPQTNVEYLLGLKHREAILEALPPGGTMFEWGCGGSTLWFREQGVNLTSLEHDKKWAFRFGAFFVNIGNIPIASPAEELCDINDAQNPYLLAFAHRKYDVILVDGVLRNKCLKVAKNMLNPGGTVFLHDFQRDWYGAGMEGYSWETLPSCDDYPGPTLGKGKLL